jgi:hypothetical protein
MPTLKACSSGWPARDPYNGLAIPPFHSLIFGINRLRSGGTPIFGGNIVQLLCNENFNRYRADVRPSGALTMERLADLRSSDVPPGNGQTRQQKRV